MKIPAYSAGKNNGIAWLRERPHAREVRPHAAGSWIDKAMVGYGSPFDRHFDVFAPPRPLAEIDAKLKEVTDRILAMIGGLAA